MKAQSATPRDETVQSAGPRRLLGVKEGAGMYPGPAMGSTVFEELRKAASDLLR